MRPIDADAFKDYIRSGYEEMKHLFNENLKVATLVTESFCKDIDEQPTIQHEPNWTPVTEGLPKEFGSYQVTTTHGKVATYVFVPDSISSHEYWKRCVLAWQPLPEPYKGVTE